MRCVCGVRRRQRSMAPVWLPSQMKYVKMFSKAPWCSPASWETDGKTPCGPEAVQLLSGDRTPLPVTVQTQVGCSEVCAGGPFPILLFHWSSCSSVSREKEQLFSVELVLKRGMKGNYLYKCHTVFSLQQRVVFFLP